MYGNGIGRFYIRLSRKNEVFDPREHRLSSLDTDTKEVKFRWKELSEGLFSSYLVFLKTKNPLYFNPVRRNMEYQPSY